MSFPTPVPSTIPTIIPTPVPTSLPPGYVISKFYGNSHCQSLSREVAVATNQCIGHDQKYFQLSVPSYVEGQNLPVTYSYYPSTNCQGRHNTSTIELPATCAFEKGLNTSGAWSNTIPYYSSPGILLEYYSSSQSCSSGSSADISVWYPINTCFRNATNPALSYSLSCNDDISYQITTYSDPVCVIVKGARAVPRISCQPPPSYYYYDDFDDYYFLEQSPQALLGISKTNASEYVNMVCTGWKRPYPADDDGSRNSVGATVALVIGISIILSCTALMVYRYLQSRAVMSSMDTDFGLQRDPLNSPMMVTNGVVTGGGAHYATAEATAIPVHVIDSSSAVSPLYTGGAYTATAIVTTAPPYNTGTGSGDPSTSPTVVFAVATPISSNTGRIHSTEPNSAL